MATRRGFRWWQCQALRPAEACGSPRTRRHEHLASEATNTAGSSSRPVRSRRGREHGPFRSAPRRLVAGVLRLVGCTCGLRPGLRGTRSRTGTWRKGGQEGVRPHRPPTAGMARQGRSWVTARHLGACAPLAVRPHASGPRTGGASVMPMAMPGQAMGGGGGAVPSLPGTWCSFVGEGNLGSCPQDSDTGRVGSAPRGRLSPRSPLGDAWPAPGTCATSAAHRGSRPRLCGLSTTRTRTALCGRLL